MAVHRPEHVHPLDRESDVPKVQVPPRPDHLLDWTGDFPLVTFGYVNHEGIASIRRVVITRVWYGFSDLEINGRIVYPQPGWFLDGVDVDKRCTRTFSSEKITNLKTLEGGKYPGLVQAVTLVTTHF